MNNNYKEKSSFDVKERLTTFQRNQFEEEILQNLNQLLIPLQNKFENQPVVQVNEPIILILGTQRSGSTLLSQILASRLNIGYPSNLMARFYETPAVGAFMQRILIGDRFHECRQYKSQHGVTNRIEEPHEFGYFWSRHLGVCDDVHEPDEQDLEKVNLEKLTEELNAIVNVFAQPVIFKCLLCDFFIPVLNQIPNVFFIDLQRNLVDVAESVWRVRQERLGSVDKWWSFRTRNYPTLKELPPEQQIAGQLLATRHSITRDLAQVSNERKMVISYEELVQAPEVIIDSFVKKMAHIGYNIPKVGQPVANLSAPQRVGEENLVRLKLRQALEDAARQ
ncbi:sulfotransferase [Nostoc sp. LEGE 06077]|uniref:sulfotransferase n=1 Tax=Nostoc sp. LEGE 06077 TaxID=915325 RepID=UPI001881CBCA|nr:sulfotransferase [Nostoc sp. LEGE 06077]MBE9207149.1 sulfotransferase [Nostoc sp. LEGE 06077]